jgi:hypothetical protein
MPRKTSSTPKLDTPTQTVKQGKFWLPNDAVWGGFINVTVKDAEKEEFLSWLVDHAKDVPSMLDDLIAEGMKYGVAFDRENECYIVTLTGALIDGANVRCCVTSRAGTWGDCDALAAWKHYIFLDGNYGDLLTTGRKRNWG